MKKELIKKLSLNKQTVAHLSGKEMNEVGGGGEIETQQITICPDSNWTCRYE